MYDTHPGKLWTGGHEERVYYGTRIIPMFHVERIKVLVYYLTGV
jgi:hypothetical protein